MTSNASQQPVGPVPVKPPRVVVALRIVVLACLVAAAHFWMYRHFGLYEDDFFFTGKVMGWDASKLAADAWENFAQWNTGRPLAFVGCKVLSFIGIKLGGLSGAYVVAWMLVSLNSAMFYLLIRRHFAEGLAFTAGVMFALYPADAARPLLTHAHQLHLSLLYLLLASHLYFTRARWLSYVVIAAALISYESPFVVFFAVPLLSPRRKRRRRELLTHTTILVGMMAVAFLIRKLTAEGRVGEALANAWLLPVKVLAAMILGPLVNLWLMLYAPLRAAKAMVRVDLGVIGTAMIGAVTVLSVLWRMRMRPVVLMPHSLEMRSAVLEVQGNVKAAEELKQAIRAARIGLILLALGYVLSFTHFPPTATLGRPTSVHLAATFGGSLMAGAVLYGLLYWVVANGRRWLGLLLVGTYAALLVGNGVVIQEGFAQSYRQQRHFWQAVTRLCPDVEDGTTILVESTGLPRGQYILVNSWAEPIILEQVYQFPTDWRRPPKVFVVKPGWESRVESTNDQWTLKPRWYKYTAILQNGKVILLHTENGRLTRVSGVREIHGQPITLKAPAKGASSGSSWDRFQRGHLHDLLIRSR